MDDRSEWRLVLWSILAGILIALLLPLAFAQDPEATPTPEEIKAAKQRGAFAQMYGTDPYGYARALAESVAADTRLTNAQRFAVLRNFLNVQKRAQGNPGQVWGTFDRNGQRILAGAVVLATDEITSAALVLTRQAAELREAAAE